ncbi:glycoside hydrolase family 57 protein [Hydrogenimonas sp.]
MIDLSFFWHMHQPDYRNGKGVMRMPWVFLHAIKDYYDMPWMVERHEGIKASFNITPPLITQLKLYEKEGYSCDRFLSLWMKHPTSLGNEERKWVQKICTTTQFETMVKPIPRYAELYNKNEPLSDNELVELEILFMLAWCGNYLRRNEPVVSTMLERGGGFKNEEKERLMDALLAFIPTILPYYASLASSHGKKIVSLSTTPLNHPILPLLLDMQNAKRSNPKTILPQNPLPLVEDAYAQVERAKALYSETFGAEPMGFWPAEGAVDEKSVAIYKERGLRWIATDEAILFRSLESDDRRELYRRREYNGVYIAFRDHTLSDLIGFTYRYKDAHSAVDDFIAHLESIDKNHETAAVSVILDGENAWEFYPNNAFDFFEVLYSRLAQTSWCKTVTMDEMAQKPRTPLDNLHPGSWIFGTFDTWVGHPQKNAAWEMIYQTRRDYLHHEPTLDKKIKEAIIEHFLASECSDWFWWYGDDHYTEYIEEFDSLFRNHLIEIYHLMNIAPPASLFVPIAGKKELHALISEPKFPITPAINGRVDSFFEWLGSGTIDESRLFSTMDRVRGPIDRIHWGEDRKNIYIRLDGDLPKLKKDGVLAIFFDESKESIEIEVPHLPIHGDIIAAAEDTVEISIAKKIFDGLQKVHMRIEVTMGDSIVQTLPGVSELEIDLNEDFSKNWFV